MCRRTFLATVIVLVSALALHSDRDTAPGAFAGSGPLRPVWAFANSGLWRSLDAGANWTNLRPASCPSGDGFVEVVNANVVIYQSCTGSVFSTSNGLAATPTWTSEGSFNGVISSFHDSNTDGVVLASDWNRVHRRDPDGSWTVSFEPVDEVGITEFVSAPAILGDVAYVALERFDTGPPAGDGSTRIYRSDDAGQSWSQVQELDDEEWFIWDALIDRADLDRVYFGEASGLRILDGGALSGPFPFNDRDPSSIPEVTSLAWLAGGDLLVGGSPEDPPGTDTNGWPVLKYSGGNYQAVATGTGPNAYTYSVAASGDGSLYFTTYGLGPSNTVYAGQDGGSWSDTGPTGARSVDAPFTVTGPAILLLHGWNSSCTSMTSIRTRLIATLGVSPERVQCVDYDSGDGVQSAAVKLAIAVVSFRRELGLGPTDEIDIVAHSMGGLAARYYREKYAWVGPIGSLSMLGTPNEGSALATIGDTVCFFLCPIVENVPFANIDPGAQALDDLAPGSDLLDELNDGFVVPSGIVYKAHAGTVSNGLVDLGLLAHPGEVGDCVVSRDSATGPDGALAATAEEYPTLYHTNNSDCGPDTLTNSPLVITNLLPTITGSGGGSFAAFSGPSSRPSAAIPFADHFLDSVLPSQQKTHQFQVPAGLGSATFALYWQDADSNPQLGLTLRRPDTTVVNPSDPGVSEIAVTDDGFAYVLARAFHITSPAAGTWEVTVDGASAPTTGQPYLAALIPETQVLLALQPRNNGLAPNDSQVLTATLFDGETPIAAGASIAAEVLTPSSSVNVDLRDDGTGGDKVSGDFVYTGTLTDTSACGGYRARATATGTSATEGTVTRDQLAFFVVHLPGDEIRDPCDTDDDDDALTDDAEIDTHLTDPQDADSDDDGCNDGREVGSNPAQGGLRNPLDVWDFMDQWIGGSRDKVVSAGDIAAVVARYGSTGNMNGDPLTPPGATTGYHVSADRAGAYPGQNPWNLQPPNGSISGGDIGAVVAQYGHNCV